MNRHIMYCAMLLMVIASTTGCKVHEQRKESLQKIETNVGLTGTMDRMAYSLRQDSLSRVWFFTTDTAFRFHPDSGLMGHAGKLLSQEANSRVARVSYQEHDSIHRYGRQVDLTTATAKSSSNADVIWTIAVAFIVLLCFMLRGKIKGLPHR
ncbi:hypothetical protein [Sphingobacterium sp. UBA5996]|uniref:hypothetical protein n=1 Tax=Sphingobacterium sp. UBA5996 TaxID=1947505 RepID=UPI0025D6BE07|nr:hypothetical protein [Sphingobacterium sp. UBA5996]